jgi:hypothetical protein
VDDKTIVTLSLLKRSSSLSRRCPLCASSHLDARGWSLKGSVQLGQAVAVGGPWPPWLQAAVRITDSWWLVL